MERKTQPLPPKNPEVGQRTDIPPDKAKRLFFQSFRFSQGQPLIQHIIFDYLHLVRPEWEMSDSLRQQVEAEVRQPIFRFITAKTTMHRKIDFFGLPLDLDKGPDKAFFDLHFNDNIESNLKKMQQAFNMTWPFDMLNLTRLIIQKDFKFLYARNGRPRDSDGKTGVYRPSLDPMLSHICYYGFEGNSTGEEEFDQMFKDVGKTALDILQGTLVVPEFMEPILNPKTKDELIKVVNKYAEAHPKSAPKLKEIGVLRV